MSIKQLSNKLAFTTSLAAALLAVVGCSLVHEDLPECPAQLSVSFVYDYNLDFSDAFSKQVESVNVWAFDKNGALAWSGSASGDALKQDGFKIDTPLGEGTYDFVSWCGLLDNGDFDLQTYTPASKEELEVKLRTVAGTYGANVSKSHFHRLFNGSALGVDYRIDPMNPSITTAEVKLMKDTKDIRVMLMHLDGSPLANPDFSATITYADSWYAWNNDLIAGCPTVTYEPWNVKYGQTTRPGKPKPGEADTAAALLFEFSTGRLMAGGDAILTIHRNWDDRDIVSIRLIDFLLMVRGHYDISDDQEYLDRQDDYSLVFFLDSNSTWYEAAGIYINSWAVVPPQSSPM